MGSILKPAVILCVVCLVVTAALAFTYSSTENVIEERGRIEAENARREVFSSAETFEAVDNIEDLTKAKPELSPVKNAYRGLKDDSIVGYVFTVAVKGYGGDMEIMVGIDTSGKITGVKIGENNETPGLGSKAAEEPFRSQLEGIAPKEPLSVVKGSAEKPEEIEAISGATITSRAVVKGVQAAVDMWAELVMKEGVQK